MISTNEPTEQTKLALQALEKAVKMTLIKKQKLGQYVVVWDGEKPVEQLITSPVNGGGDSVEL